MSDFKLSVVIPVRDQTFSLRMTLLWFAKFLTSDSEVIVVDDGSRESLNSLIDSFKDKMSINLIEQGQLGRAAARNIGWKNAQGERIWFNDADRFPSQESIDIHKYGDGVVIGQIQELYFPNPENMESVILGEQTQIKRRARQPLYPKLILSTLFDEHGRSRTRIGWAAFFSGNVSVPRKYLEKVGGYDEQFRSWGVEHFELGYRLWKENLSFNYELNGMNFHIAHPRDTGFYQSQMNESMAYFISKYPGDISLHKFHDFLFGHASLQEVEEATQNGGIDDDLWINSNSPPIYFKGLSSHILAKHVKG